MRSSTRGVRLVVVGFSGELEAAFCDMNNGERIIGLLSTRL